mmetsp:Transcript_75019/g.150820  ORF Transcript_75019/g.150820 Transcript_75019/m.150820 type:complete len:251 (-) Transcript_75019:239-991(-)
MDAVKPISPCLAARCHDSTLLRLPMESEEEAAAAEDSFCLPRGTDGAEEDSAKTTPCLLAGGVSEDKEEEAYLPEEAKEGACDSPPPSFPPFGVTLLRWASPSPLLSRSLLLSGPLLPKWGMYLLRKLKVVYQGRWPQRVERKEAEEPRHSVPAPDSLKRARTSRHPSTLPCTCAVVLHTSKGIKTTRQLAARIDPIRVWATIGSSLVSGRASKTASTTALDAVSPKRLNGPCTNAGSTPEYNRANPPPL